MPKEIVKEIPTPGPQMKVTDDLAKGLDGVTSVEEIREMVAAEAAKQGFVVARNNKGQFQPAEQTPVIPKPVVPPADEEEKPVVYEDDFVIGGKSYHFEGESPGDINRQVRAALSAHENAIKPPEQKADPAADEKKRKDELLTMQLDVMSGKMSIDDYIVKSGAVEKYLQSKGLSTDELKEATQERKSNKEVNAWEAASEAFKALEGNDWPGGEQNLKLIGYKLAEMNLNNSPSVESLQKAYDSMKADGIVFPVVPPAQEEATEPKPEPARKKLAASAPGFGIGGKPITPAKTEAAGIPVITDSMSPREIMESFKAAAVAQGRHPDDILKESYAARA